MRKEFSLMLLIIFNLFFIVESHDEHTLSNYEDIKLTNLSGIFSLDFKEKIVNGNLIYTFHSQVKGTNITLDTFHLKIFSIKQIKGDGEENITLNYSMGNTDENLGTPLIIDIEYDNDTDIIININYATTSEAGAGQFLNESQTVGKKYPYFFSISEMTYGRELLPSQDTPAVKFPFNLGIKVPFPLRGMISGLYEKKDFNEEENTTTFYYHQDVPIPNYLIALAAGNIVEKEISDNINVYSEPEYIDDAAKEFEDMPQFLNNSISYMGEYRWGNYNVLVLPHSFPYSGMENPCLTFASPCLINGDKSLVDLIAHELIHSWSGNLVTNENWRDFWLNEGITKFLQRKIIALWQNDDYAKMDYMLGLSYIKKYLGIFGINSTFTSLRPNLTGIRPDTKFSNIPYEKGSNFIYYLEGIVGNETMKNFFESYFNHFEKKSVDVFDFKNYFLEFCNESNVNTSDILWDEWIFQPGDCPVPNNFSNEYNDNLTEFSELFINETYEGLADKFNNLSSTAKTVFFLRLEERNIFLTDKQHDFLTNTLKLYENQNYLVRTHYLRAILKETDKFYDHELDDLIDYLTTYGVSDFQDGVYRLFYKRDEVKAVEVLNSCKNFYHSLMLDMAEEEIKNAQTSFPIFSLESNDKCLVYNKEIKLPFDVILNYEIKDLDNIEAQDKIYLKSEDDKQIELSCSIDFNKQKSFCLPKEENIDSGNYHLEVPERIQKKTYAVKQFNSSNTFNLYTKDINVDIDNTKKEYEIDYEKQSSEIINITLLNEPEEEFKLKNGDEEIACKYDFSKSCVLECEINQTILNYDEKDPKNFKKYTLKLYNICGKEKFSLDVKVKNGSQDEDKEEKDDKFPTYAIILISVGGAIILILIVFLVIRALRKNKEDKTISVETVSGERILEDQ